MAERSNLKPFTLYTAPNGNRYIVVKWGEGNKRLAYIGHYDPERPPDTSDLLPYDVRHGGTFVDFSPAVALVKMTVRAEAAEAKVAELLAEREGE